MVGKWIKDGADETLAKCTTLLESAAREINRYRSQMNDGSIEMEQAMSFTANTLARTFRQICASII